jgi:SAM-dependent methyltransferase
MFDFVRKRDLWQLIDEGARNEFPPKGQYELKSAQDLAVYGLLRGSEALAIAEVGGGNSRLLGALAARNRCVNIDKFEGLGNGPIDAGATSGVEVVHAYLGEFDPVLKPESFDVVFSISVVEHVETPRLDLFHRDLLRVLKPTGRFIHAIDMYIADEVSEYQVDRYERYREWVSDGTAEPLGAIRGEPPVFECSMASNPDNVLYSWGVTVPALRDLREEAQSVSLIVGGRKPG